MKNIAQTFVIIIVLFGCTQKNEIPSDVQQESEGKIKVYLLGTFHFAQTDSTYNVLDSNHQKSIEELSNLIALQKPNKVFVERQPEFEYQNKVDSLYSVYQKLTRPIRARNEIYQVGFRVAKILGHKKVYQCDNPGRYGKYYDDAFQYAKKNQQMDILDAKRIGPVGRYDDLVNEDSIMKNSTHIDYIQWINSEPVMTTSHASYVTNYPQIGSTNFYDYNDDNTLIGAELTADWYRRNIMIYSKMINQLDCKENAIVLIVGADHVPILKRIIYCKSLFQCG